MKLFLDTANLEEIREIKRWGVLGGLTSNPTLIAKENPTSIEAHMKELVTLVEGPVSLETTASDADAIYDQGVKLSQVGPNAVVKVVMTPEGLAAGKRLADEGIPVNVTLTFSPAQAILAAEIGATYVSPFLGRVDDVGSDGMHVLAEICEIYDVQGYDTQVLAASLRHPMHVVEAARLGADVATIPYDVFSKLKDWEQLQKELQEGAS